MESSNQGLTGKTVLELEHAIGYSGHVTESLYFAPSGNEYAYVAGACVVISDVNDSHKQEFLRGHDDQVTCLRLSNTGKYIASGQLGENADITVWDYPTRKFLFRLTEHDYGIDSIDISHDELLLVSVGSYRDNRVVIWDLSTGCVVTHTHLDERYTKGKKLDPNVQRRSLVAFGGHTRDIKRRETANYQFAVSCDKKLIHFDLDPYNGKLTRSVLHTKQQRNYSALKFSPRGDLIFGGTSSGDVIIFSVKLKAMASFVKVCTNGVSSLRVASDDLLLVGGGDGTFTEFKKDPYSGKFVSTRSVEVSKGSVNTITPMGKSTLLCACATGDAHELEMSNFKKKVFFESHYSGVVGMAFPKFTTANPNEGFVSCSKDRTVQYWDLSDYSVKFCTQYSNNSFPNTVTFVGDTNIVVSGWSDGSIRGIDSLCGEKTFSKVGAHRKSVTRIVSGTNCKFLLSSGVEGEVKVWSVKGINLVSHFQEHKQRVTDMALFSDDVHFLSCSTDRSVLCWDLRKERVISSFRSNAFPFLSISLHQNQLQFSTIGKKVVTHWDIRQPKPTKITRYTTNETAEGLTIAYTNNKSNYYAAAGTDEIVRLYDTRTCALVSKGSGHSGAVNEVSFSPDDKQLISVGDDGMCLVWNKFEF